MSRIDRNPERQVVVQVLGAVGYADDSLPHVRKGIPILIQSGGPAEALIEVPTVTEQKRTLSVVSRTP